MTPTTVEELRAALERAHGTLLWDNRSEPAGGIIRAILAALPSDGVIVTEEGLAAALMTGEIGQWLVLVRNANGDGDRLADGFAEDFARAIVAALRKESGDA